MQHQLNHALRLRLEALAEPGYQKFSSALIPNIPPDTILGVRLPLLRKIASQLARRDWRAYLEDASDDSFEEILLQGMVIGYATMPPDELFRRIEAFLPKINNWSACDSFCTGLQAAKRWREEMWTFIGKCLTSERAYTVRFGAVMLLHYYVDEARLDATLQRLNAVRHDSYYVKMAVAWAVSICFTVYPVRTMAFLQECALDHETYCKTLQKILESRRVRQEDKAAIRVLRASVGQRNGGAHA